jgi:hypothetical protein
MRPAHPGRGCNVGLNGQDYGATWLPCMCDHTDRLQCGAIAGGIGVRAGSEARRRAAAPLPVARMAGRRPTWTLANLGTNRTSGRFVGARWSILASLSDVHGRARTAGRTIDRSTAGPFDGMSGCAPLAGCWALDLPVCAGQRAVRALSGGRGGDVVRATCCPSCGPPAGCRSLEQSVQFRC